MVKIETLVYLALCTLFCIFLAVQFTEGKAVVNYKIDWRIVDCKPYIEGTSHPATSCVVLLNNVTQTKEDCFEEITEEGVRVYCRIHCEQTSLNGEITLEKSDNNNKCIKHFNYNNELLYDDWYAWRSGECLKQDISFLVRCWPELIATRVPRIGK